MVSIRMEAIGGQGANSAGKILAEAAVLGMGYTGNHFSSFGSEKRGSPVRSFVRFSPEKNAIRSASFIAQPDLLIVFHEAMLHTHLECLEGVSESTDILVNSPKSPGELQFPRGTKLGRVMTLDASKIALQEQCGLNNVMLGAALAALPEIDEKVLRERVLGFFSKLTPQLLKRNASGFSAGIKKVETRAFSPDQARLERAHGSLPRLGWLNSPIGGVIAHPGNTALRDKSVSRKGVVPRLNPEVCFHCGFCDMVCPDYCFVWERDPVGVGAPRLKGIDYQFCKACQKCISICPVEALTPVLESELTADERAVKLFPSVTPDAIEARWRGMDWESVTQAMPADERMLTLQTELLDPKSYIKPDFSKVKVPGRKGSEGES